MPADVSQTVGVNEAPDAHTPEAVEFGRWLFAQECRFVNGSTSLDTIPDWAQPEVAFAGRSNVGKSSLINALTGRKTLARASNTPGRTQQINFFNLGAMLMLVDLPGYGYAEAPKRDIARWTRLVGDYLRGRPTLRRTCLLIDSRHGIKSGDLEVMAALDEVAVSYQVVLTKIDKLRPAEMTDREAATLEILKQRRAAYPGVHKVSAITQAGISDLRAALAGLAQPASVS